jgi:hypothetical protein
MSRTRLTKRTAAEIDNDVYNMNDTGHEKNDPKIDEYAKGDPSAWAEDVHKENPAADDQKREETGHAPLIDKHAASEAIASAKKLEERAVKAIIASQRMLPGATDEIIEKQAAILMNLPEEGLNATLKNQENLAKMIVKNAEDASDDAEEEEKEEEKEDEKEEEKEEKEATEEASEKDVIASLQAKIAELEQKLNVPEKEATEETAEKEAGDDEDKKEEEKEEKEEEKEEKEATETEIEASDSNILDQIFSGAVASNTKKGASKLSGMVKKEASEGSKELSDLWSSSPDVTSLFQ